MCVGGVDDHCAEGLEAEVALVVYRAEPFDKAFPVDRRRFAPDIRIGDHVKVAVAVVVVYMQDREPVSESDYVFLEVSDVKVRVTYIKAEAEYLLARLGIEGVDVAARFGNVGAGALDISSVDARKKVFKAYFDAVLLLGGLCLLASEQTAAAFGVGTTAKALFTAILGVVTTNGIAEAIAAVIIGVAVGKAVSVYLKRHPLEKNV